MSTIGNSRTRAALWAAAAIVVVVGLIDAGSCVIARIQLDEDAKMSARYAVQQISGLEVSQATAEVAYNAATEALPNDRESIVVNGPGDGEDFRLNADKSITMTVTREAPTLVFKFIPGLKDFTEPKVTYTQAQLGM